MRDLIRKARWVAGILWFLGWFELYLEIYRHHHVTPSFRFNSPSPQARPGAWLLTVLACSALAPPVFAALFIWSRGRRGRGDTGPGPDAAFPIAPAAMTFGIFLSVVGTLNQLIQRSPIGVDITLRTGNGGFIVLGVALVFVGWMLGRLETTTAAGSRSAQ